MIRIVKMTFAPENVDRFMALFEERKSQIAGFEGCEMLQLLREQPSGRVFFTYSQWRSPDDLARYRQSELFADTWQQTKKLFSAKPEAWSTDVLHNLG